MNAAMGFVELGFVVLAWSILLGFLIKGITAQHSDKPWAQGLAALFHA